jgi:hypothetical protein
MTGTTLIEVQGQIDWKTIFIISIIAHSKGSSLRYRSVLETDFLNQPVSKGSKWWMTHRKGTQVAHKLGKGVRLT